MKKIRVKIETLSPIVLATRTNTTVMTSSHDFFSGTLVRGMLEKLLHFLFCKEVQPRQFGHLKDFQRTFVNEPLEPLSREVGQSRPVMHDLGIDVDVGATRAEVQR